MNVSYDVSRLINADYIQLVINLMESDRAKVNT